MAVRGHREAMKGLRSFADGTERHVEQVVDDVVLTAAIRGEAKVRETIDTTPSDLSSRPKGNRNWTFTMRNRGDSRVSHRGRRRRVAVGWLDDRRKYFLIQEHGGRVGDKVVTPMNALVKSVQEMKAAIGIGLVSAGIRRK